MGTFHHSFNVFVVADIFSAAVLGCSGGPGSQVNGDDESAAQVTEQSSAEPIKMPGTTDYAVPAEAAEVANPIEADADSLDRGGRIYESSCLNCHGSEGDGKGPTASRLDPEPADFRADRVLNLSDGELFYMITIGIEGSAMIPFNYLNEEQRWHLVNYIRSFQE
jgi:mono/diheme cytochrome c family protein